MDSCQCARLFRFEDVSICFHKPTRSGHNFRSIERMKNCLFEKDLKFLSAKFIKIDF